MALFLLGGNSKEAYASFGGQVHRSQLKLELQLPKDYVNIPLDCCYKHSWFCYNFYSRILLRTHVQALSLVLGSRMMKET